MHMACIPLLLVSLPILATQNLQVPSPTEIAGIRLTIVLDTSASMDDMLKNVQAAGVRLVESLGEGDLVQVLRFGSKVETVHGPSSNHVKVAKAISAIPGAAGTSSLYNTLYLALKYSQAEGADARPGVIVVISDGEDTSSRVTRHQLEQFAEGKPVRVYSILLPKRRRRAEESLSALAKKSGGREWQPANERELESAVEALIQELKGLSTLR